MDHLRGNSRVNLLLLLGIWGLLGAQSNLMLGTLDLQIDEGQPAGTIIGDISAGLPPGSNTYMYFISAQEGSGVTTDLGIDENTGIIKTAKVLDRESREQYSFIAVTTEGVTVEVTIRVNDINDHAPAFPESRSVFRIPEHTPIGTRFPLDPAFDADSGQLNTQGYIIKQGNIGQAFRLDTRRGSNGVLYLDIVVSGVLDRENRSSFSLVLEAYDGGSPHRSTQMILDIVVQDINDNAPAFNESRYHTLISENLKPGSNILQVFASDADQGENGVIIYEINRRQSDPDKYFEIDAKTGVIKLSKGLDYEMRRVHELVVQARDNATHPEVSTAFVSIHVRDYNDNQPTMTIIFLSEDGSPQVSEGAQPGQYVARISVSDPDYGEYSNVNVSLEGGDGKFALTTKDNIIYLIIVDKHLDREERDSYELRVMATDSGTPPLRAESSFVLQVVDINDNPPLFDQQVYKQTIPEVVYPGSFVLQVTARDKDQGPNGDIFYSILHNQDTNSDWFTIDPATGIITTTTPLDYEKDPQPKLTVMATDGGSPALSSTAVVKVALQDVNDNEPTFSSNFYNVSLKENTPIGTCFLQVSAADADSGTFGSISYSLGSGIGSLVPTHFRIHKQTGELCTAQSLDRDEGTRTYDFTISAVDGGGLNSMAYVKVFLDDINDNRPVFYPVDYAVSLSTQSMPGTAVVKVTAHDKDEGVNGKVTYRMVSGNSPPLFTLNKETGVISLSWALNGKANSLIQLVVSAHDGGGLSAQVNARVNISIVPGSVSPPFFEQPQYLYTVPEDIRRGASVGTVWAHNPAGHTEAIFYSISSGDPNGYFVMDSSTGQIRTNIPLDHEAHPTIMLDVQARSGTPPAYSNTRVKITISDINDNAPSFATPSDSILVPEATEIGSTIYTLHAEDQDSGPNGHVQFDLVPSGERLFSIDRTSGRIRLIGALQYDTSSRYDLKILAKDSGVPQLSSTFTLFVHVQAENDNGPIFDTLTYRVEVKEGTSVNSRFLQVRALSQDNGASQVTYHLRSDGDSASFGIVPESGWLFVKSTLDRETKDLYILTVLASSGGNDQKKTGTTTVRVSITDENDNVPKLSEERYFFTITENQPGGSAVGRVMATDRDSGPNSRLTYRLLQHDPNFSINAQTGDVSVRRSLDREQQSSYQLLVMVQDGGTPPRSTTGTIYVTVLDENDNAPAFLHALAGREFSVQVQEGKASGAFVASLQAKDPDEGENATVFYSLTGSWAERFTINPNTGELRTATVLHRAERAEYTFTVKASDRGPQAKSTSAFIRIQVLPSSRLQPKPDSTMMTLHSVEGVRPGSVIGSVAPKAPSRHPNNQLTYTIVGGTDSAGTFVVDSTTGDIYLARELDYEAGAHYTLQISAEDASRGYLVSNLMVVDINIQDRNDHSPEFLEDPVTVVVSEDAEVGASIFTFQALDKDGAGPNSEVFYTLVQQSPLDGHFQLNAHTGILSVAKALDREGTSSFLLVVRATDQALNITQRKSSSVTGRVFVTDENDNAPVFLSPTAVSVMEDQPTGFVVLYIIAQDKDLGENGRVSYQIRSGNADGKFHLNPSTGSLAIVKGLDREEQDQYNLTVVATDHGNPRRMTTQSLSILVIDVNDEAPAFEKTEYEVLVMENQPAGTTVLSMLAADRDSGSNGAVRYSAVTDDGFRIDPVTGVVTTTRSLDRETREHYIITVYAKDGGVPPHMAKATLKVTVGDENDHTPAFQGDSGYLEVPENQGRVVLLTLRATDSDAGENGRVEYHIMEGDPNHDFILDSAMGALATARNLDREVTAEYSLIVVARDQGSPQRSVAIPLTIRILDLNDNAPAFSEASYTLDVPEDVPLGHSVLQLSAMDEDEGTNGQISYYLGNESLGMFHIDPETGLLTTALPLDREKRAVYSFLAKAVDSAPSDPKSSSVHITVNVRDVNDNAPFFTQNPLFVNVSRTTPLKQVVATMKAEDKDAGANASILYRFNAVVSGFSINSYTGEIQLTEPLASKNQKERTLFVVATDLGSPALSTTGVVVIYLLEETYRGVRFPRSAREVALPENAAPGTAVLSIKAVHVAGSSGRITYSIVSGNEDQAFVIQPNTGDISIQRSERLDFESTPKLHLVIQAETTASFGFMGLHLNLQDINDNLPRFQLQNYVAFIWEAQGYGLPVIQVLADDADQGQNGQVMYAIQQSQPMKGLFNIDPQTGTITTAAILDREIWSRTRLVVTAMDRGNPPLIGSATLTVVVMDLNDNSPTIPLPLQLRVRENTTIGTEITQVTGNDVDSGPALSYTLLLNGAPAGTFSILRYGGHITLMEPLDYEDRSWYTLTIRSSDSRHETEANLTIIVEDVNDNPPEFTQELYQVTLLEHTAPGTPVLTVTATDRDSGENGRVTYHVASTAMNSFYIDSHNGTLFTSQRVEFDSRRPTLDVLIEARDHGSPTLSSYATIQIQVQDVNDNTPYFHQSQYNTSISEDLRPGTTVLTLEATDDDLSRENAGFDYTIVSGNTGNSFQLESSVRFVDGRFQTIGAIILVDKLDFETISIYNLTVAASDRGIPQKSAVVPVVVSILDVNDNPPVFPRTEYSIQVSESAPVSTEVLRVAAHDSDSSPNDFIHYKISSGDQNQLFHINEGSGAIRLVQPLDRELQAVHVLVIQASDSRGSQGNFALVPVTIEVKDINDNKPYFPVETLTTSIRENQPPNTVVTVIHAIDFDTGVYGQIRYTVLDLPMAELGEGKNLFSVNETSGELRSKLMFDYERTKGFKMMVKAVDAGNFSASVTVQVLVTGEDEYDPVFLAPSFNFDVPEGAQKDEIIGRVMATDEDEGADGVILYSFAKPSPYFGVNETTGHIYLKMDSQRHRSGRAKRETREMTMDIHARSPLPTSRVATSQVTVDVTNTSFGLAPDLNIVLVIAVAASLGVVVIIAVVAIVLVVCRSRRRSRKKPETESQLNNIQSSSMQKIGHDDATLASSDRIYHQTLPGFSSDQSGVGGTYTRGGSLDPSHSSGRGSAEAAEDDEIRMINEYPRVASITSSMQDHISARGPDSGIQQDADQLSDISCDPSMETSQWFKNKKGSGLLAQGQPHLYRDDGGGFVGVGCGLNISHPKDYAFPEDGKPSVDGSLTAIVASDEELRGSYNWDYLLNWCPQFQPLASVFTEIARLKDETTMRRPFQPKPKAEPKPRIDPPPLITSVAHPGAKTVPPKPAIGRTFPHLSSLRRSPISHEGSLSSAAMSPSFSPSLSPLAARSPVVSPFGVSQGPSASIISTGHSLDNADEAELRI